MRDHDATDRDRCQVFLGPASPVFVFDVDR